MDSTATQAIVALTRAGKGRSCAMRESMGAIKWAWASLLRPTSQWIWCATASHHALGAWSPGRAVRSFFCSPLRGQSLTAVAISTPASAHTSWSLNLLDPHRLVHCGRASRPVRSCLRPWACL